MDVLKVYYFILLVLVASCGSSDHNPGTYIEDLGVFIDSTEVSIKQFDDYVKSHEVKLASDSVSGFYFDLSTSRWIESSELSYLKPNSKQVTDSLQPATVISWEDACAYCNAKNGRLLKPAEWLVLAEEYHLFNIWEGYYPLKDEGLDGYLSVPCGVTSGGANNKGLYNLQGNVWEWVDEKVSEGVYLLKGGSYLSDYNSEEFTPEFIKPTNHLMLRNDIGFRCAYDYTK